MPPPQPNENDSCKSTSPRLTVEALLNLINDKAQFVQFTLDHDRLEESSLALLQIVFPDWFSTSPKNHLKLVQCTNGITNKLMKCKNISTGQVVLIRAYGKKSELIIDRQAELIENGLAPPLHCRFENGFVYGYVPGIPLKPTQLAEPEYFPLIAHKLALWHQVDTVPGDRSPRIFRTLAKWFKRIPETYSRPETQSKFLTLPFTLADLQEELKELEILTTALNCPVVFCHNDLLCANIIYNTEKRDVAFIDYEYGSFNYRSFDLANHFCEFAGFDCDYSLFPSDDFQRKWIQEYLTAFEGGSTPPSERIEKVLKEVAILILVAHFFWGLWGLIQAQHSDIQFDYMSYAASRFTEYKRHKNKVMRNAAV